MNSNTNKEIMNKKEIENNIHILSEGISKEFINIKYDKEVKSAIEQDENESRNEMKNIKGRNKIIDKDNVDTINNDNQEEESENYYNNEQDMENKKIAFFIRPHLSFHLSEQTKKFFINSIDRSSILKKYSSLISFADYCSFEMMYNMLYINNSIIKKKLSRIELSKMQIINYILILIENVLLIIHYFRSPYITHDIYDVVDKSILYKVFFDIWIVMLIKLGIIGFVCIIYF